MVGSVVARGRRRPAGDRDERRHRVDGQCLGEAGQVSGRVGDRHDDAMRAVGEEGSGHRPGSACWTSPVRVWLARVTVTVVPGATAAVPEMVGVGSLVSASPRR